MPRFDCASSLQKEVKDKKGINEGDVPDIGIFLAHADHNALMTGATDDGTGWGGDNEKEERSEKDVRKDGTRSIIAWEDEERGKRDQ